MSHANTLGSYLHHFLVDYLVGQRNASAHTVHAYRDALKGLLLHVAEVHQRQVCDLRLDELDQQAVLSYLQTIEQHRGNCPTTRNLRLTAIRSFFRAVGQLAPEHLQQAQRILAIPQKRTATRAVGYLSVAEIQTLLRQPPVDTWRGRRDHALLRFLYNTGARVQEALDVSIARIRFETPPHVHLLGKGRKERLCPLWPDTVSAVQQTLRDRTGSLCPDALVFTNRQGNPLSRCGVRYILTKYVRMATPVCSSLQDKCIHPHSLRHYLPFLTMSGNARVSEEMIGKRRSKRQGPQPITRHSFMELQAVEEVQQPVAGLIATRFALPWGHFGERLLLHGEGGFKVHLGGFDPFMAEP